MNEQLGSMLKEFIKTFEASLDPRLWVKLIKEEMEETKEALALGVREDVLKEVTDLMYVTVGFNYVTAGAEQMELFSDREKAELMSLIQESSETYDKAIDFMGAETNFYEAFRRVHLSNMSKLDNDGKPIKREDGKVLKSDNYRAANLEDLV